jgi:lantibiotic modifying enzyme
MIGIARACGDRLLATSRQTEHGTGWICGDTREPPLTGFAHGNAGIAYALLATAQMTGEARFRTAACAAINYERALFSPEHANWPDLRAHSRGSFATVWCHGAPGIGLSRVCSLGYLHDPLLKQEIDTALSTTLLNGFGGSHILCHGDLGNADILLHAAEILEESRWRLHARREAARVIASAKQSSSGKPVWNCGHPLGVESPGLMTGLAGIGYALLRLADPAKVPCILALEPPRSI